MNTVAFMRLHAFNADPIDLVIDTISQYVDGMFFLVHNLQNQRLLDAASAHPKCVDIRYNTRRDFESTETLQKCFDWAREIRPRYVLEFDEDELPPAKFDEVLHTFKTGSKLTLWFEGLWAFGDAYTVALTSMRRYFFHMKAYKWSGYLLKRKRAGYCSFEGVTQKSKVSFLSKYPLIHLAFMTKEMRDRRMQVGDSKGHKYNEHSWFVQPDIQTVPYDPNKTNIDWMNLYHEAKALNYNC